MRLDRFLKRTGIIKRRAIAQEMIEGGKVLKNGKSLKNSYRVKKGDEIEVVYFNRILKIKVESVNEKDPKCEVLLDIRLEKEF